MRHIQESNHSTVKQQKEINPNAQDRRRGKSVDAGCTVCVMEHKEMMMNEPQLQAATQQNIECISSSGKVKSQKTVYLV